MKHVVFYLILYLLSPVVLKARDGRYCNVPRLSVGPSVHSSVTFSFRNVTRKRIDVFFQNLQVRAPCHGGVAGLF